MKNYYNILNVSSTADAGQIKKAYRGLCKRFHPDRHGGSRYHEEKFKEINEAYRVLMDPLKRDAYNRQLVVRVRPRPKPESEPARSYRTDWGPPDYSREGAGSAASSNYGRSFSYAPGERPAAGPERGGGGFFWSMVLVLVFFLPMWMSTNADAAPPPAEPVSYDVLEEINKRYQREIYYLNEIKKIDPNLARLDLNTGYYQLHDKTIRLSWEMLQLIRKNGWKVRS